MTGQVGLRRAVHIVFPYFSKAFDAEAQDPYRDA